MKRDMEQSMAHPNDAALIEEIDERIEADPHRGIDTLALATELGARFDQHTVERIRRMIQDQLRIRGRRWIDE